MNFTHPKFRHLLNGWTLSLALALSTAVTLFSGNQLSLFNNWFNGSFNRTENHNYPPNPASEPISDSANPIEPIIPPLSVQVNPSITVNSPDVMVMPHIQIGGSTHTNTVNPWVQTNPQVNITLPQPEPWSLPQGQGTLQPLGFFAPNQGIGWTRPYPAPHLYANRDWDRLFSYLGRDIITVPGGGDNPHPRVHDERPTTCTKEDDFTSASVPEPGLVLGLGVLGMMLTRWAPVV